MGCLKLDIEHTYTGLKVVYSAASKSGRELIKDEVETGYYYFGEQGNKSQVNLAFGRRETERSQSPIFDKVESQHFGIMTKCLWCKRYYDPRTSQWLSVDPMAGKYPNMSPYNYCLGNPIKLIDPDGMDPTPFPKHLLGSFTYYQWRAVDFMAQNPGKKVPSYYLEYGGKYILRFTFETNNILSNQGKQWLVNARRNLQVAIENRLAQPDGAELERDDKAFKEFAFNSHVDAYWRVGLYKLNTVDLVAIVLTPNFEDLTSEEGMKQSAEMMGKLTDYWLANPLEGLKRGIELLANQDKIKAMVTAKAIREGIDPDKAMPILEKIIEKIPTITPD